MKLKTVLFLAFFMQNCSSPVVRRDNRGMVLNSVRSQKSSFIKKKVVVLELFNESPVGGEDLSITCGEELKKELVRTGEFIIDPLAENIGPSKEIYAGGGIKLIQMAKRAKLAGINFILYGRIKEARIREKQDEIGIIRKSQSFTEAKVEIRIFDVVANKEIYSGTIQGGANDGTYRFFASDPEEQISYRQELLRYAVKVAVRKSIPKILEISSRMDWMGRVAKVVGAKIYVNAGRGSGLQLGDILKVVTEGDEIYDPETGALLGMTQGEVKGTLEVVDYFGPDGTIAILHSGGSVMEGDFVQLY